MLLHESNTRRAFDEKQINPGNTPSFPNCWIVGGRCPLTKFAKHPWYASLYLKLNDKTWNRARIPPPTQIGKRCAKVCVFYDFGVSQGGMVIVWS